MGRYGFEDIEDDQKIEASTPVSTRAINLRRPLLPDSLMNSWRYQSHLRRKTRSTSTITKEQELPGASTAIKAVEILSMSSAGKTKERFPSINIQGWSKDAIINHFHLKDGILDKSDFLWEENSCSSSPALLVEEASREDIHVHSRRDEAERVKFGSEGLLALQQSERQPGHLMHEEKAVHNDQKRKRPCSPSFSSEYHSTPPFHKKKRCAGMAEAEEVCQPMREKQPMYEEQPLPSKHSVQFEEQPMRKEQPTILGKHFMREEHQHEGQIMRNETQSSTLNDAPETVRTCLRNVDISDFSNVLYGQIAKEMLSSTDLERSVCECLHEIQFDMSDIQHIVRTSQLTTLSNQAKTIRSLARVVITHRLQENLLLKEISRIQNEVRLLKAYRARAGAHALTVPVRNQVRWALNYENLKKVYVLNRRKPFKRMNLNLFLKHHVEVAEIAKDAFDEITCFLRSLFTQICDPDPSDIWEYSDRAFNHLIELPGTIFHTLIDFIVELMGLGQQELSSCKLEGLRSSNNGFWLSLGNCEEDRERKFKYLLKAKCDWIRISKACVAKALEDVRRNYCMSEGRLVPAKNGRHGMRWADKKALTPEAWRQLALRESGASTQEGGGGRGKPLSF